MRHTITALIIVLAAAAFTGCATTHPSATAYPEPAPTVKVAAKEAPTAESLLEQAQSHLEAADALMTEERYDEALRELLAGMGALSDLDAKGDAQIRGERDELVAQLGLASVRTIRLHDGYAEAADRSYPLDFQYNEDVEYWLNFWLTRGRTTIEVYLSRSGRYIDRVREIIIEEGLPEELAYLPLIESGYSPLAHSRANAVGAWQFIRSTGKIYNLNVDGQVDERRDVEKATRSACAYLRKLHDQFGRWDLALAAYNAGENGVGRAIDRKGVADYWQLDLPTETQNYVPKFYAALMIARDPAYFGIEPQTEPPLEVAKVDLERPVDLKKIAEKTDVPYEAIKEVNPEILGQYTPIKVKHYALKVPAEHHEQFASAFDALPDDVKYLSDREIKKVESGTQVTIHVVRQGDTLYQIARKYRTTVEKIRRWNRLGRSSIIRPGQRLKIYGNA